MSDKEVTPEMIAQMLGQQTREFYQKQAERPTPPLGKYIQWVIIPNSETLQPGGGGLYLRFECVPLRRMNDGESAILGMKTNHMMFPPKPAAEGEEQFNNLFPWLQFFEATKYELPSDVIDPDTKQVIARKGPIPAKGEYNSSTRTYYVDGQQVDRDAWVQRDKVDRVEWARAAIVNLFTQVGVHKMSPLGNLAFFGKMAQTEDGQYTNIVTSKKKGGGPLVGALPPGEEYAFALSAG